MSAGQPSSLDLDALDLNPKALEGRTVVITGTLPNLSRKQAQELVERSGGKVTGSISSKTNLLIAGDKAGSKLKKAEELGVEVLDEDGLKKLICQSGSTKEEDHDSIVEYTAEGISDAKEFLNSPLGKLFQQLNKQRVRIHSEIEEDLRDGLNYMYSGDRKGAWICFHEMDYSDLLESNTCHIAFGISDPGSLLNDQDKLNYYNKDKKRFFAWDEDEFNAVVEKATKTSIDDKTEYPDIAKIALVDHYIQSKDGNMNNILYELDDIEKTRGNQIAVKDLGERIVKLLEDEGIKCEWNKDPKKRIMIELNYDQSDYCHDMNDEADKPTRFNESDKILNLYEEIDGAIYSPEFFESPFGKSFAVLNESGIRAVANCGLSLRDGYAVINSDGYKGPWVFFHEQDYVELLKSDRCHLAFGLHIEKKLDVGIDDEQKILFFNKDKKRFFHWDEEKFNKIVEEATHEPIDDSKEYPDIAKIALVDHFIDSGASINSILDQLDNGTRVIDSENQEIQSIKQLGNRIITTLEKEGHTCEWDQDIDTRIMVELDYSQRDYCPDDYQTYVGEEDDRVKTDKSKSIDFFKKHQKIIHKKLDEIDFWDQYLNAAWQTSEFYDLGDEGVEAWEPIAKQMVFNPTEEQILIIMEIYFEHFGELIPSKIAEELEDQIIDEARVLENIISQPNQLESSETIAEKIIKKDDDARRYIDTAKLKYRGGDMEGALKDLNRALQIDSRNVDAHYNRGIAKKGLGDINGACIDWTNAVRMGDDGAKVLIDQYCQKYNVQKNVTNPAIKEVTQKDFTKLINYDLQKDYVDKLMDYQKLDLFRSLGDEIQNIADKMWNSQDNYSTEFMIDWITKHYSQEVLTPFNDEEENKEYEDWDSDHVLRFWFIDEFEDVEDIEGYDDFSQFDEEKNILSLECPSFWLDVPREFLISWAMKYYKIDAKFVKDMTCDG